MILTFLEGYSSADGVGVVGYAGVLYEQSTVVAVAEEMRKELTRCYSYYDD